MARSIVYIGIRAAQTFFAFVVLGIAGFLLSDIKRSSYFPSNTEPWNSSGDAFNVGGTPLGLGSQLSSLGSSNTGYSGSTNSGSSNTGSSNIASSRSRSRLRSPSSSSSSSNTASLAAAAAAADAQTFANADTLSGLFRRSPKSKSSGKSVTNTHSNGSNGNPSPTMKYTVPLNMLVAVSVFTFITAIVSAVFNFLSPVWAIFAFWFFSGWDAFLAILWIAAAGLTGTFLTQYSGWKADFKQAHLFKTCFAFAFIFMLSMFSTAVMAFLMCWAERKKTVIGEENANASVETSAPVTMPVNEKSVMGSPPYYEYQPPEQPYQPSMTPQPYQPSVSPVPQQVVYEAPATPQMQPAPPMQSGLHPM